MFYQNIVLCRVSVLFSEPKIPQSNPAKWCTPSIVVSVLFSEPKIPQCIPNSSDVARLDVSVLFSEPKIPQCKEPDRPQACTAYRFSALQRAENSSI